MHFTIGSAHFGGHEWVERIAPAFLLRPSRLGNTLPKVPGTGLRADLYLAKRVLFDDLPIDLTVYELPRELDPLVYRRAPSHGEQ